MGKPAREYPSQQQPDAPAESCRRLPCVSTRPSPGGGAPGRAQPPSALIVPRSFARRAKPGSTLWGEIRLGRLLGAGVQARVFELLSTGGVPIGKVLKIAHPDLAHQALNNDVVWISMKREWEVGTQLRAALEEPGERLPGFMRVCDCVVATDSRKGGRGDFSGMIMERLTGWETYRRIDTPEFHNIAYVKEMLFQVFSALDRGQRKIGFSHADLGLRNVFEHYPRLFSAGGDGGGQEQRFCHMPGCMALPPAPAAAGDPVTSGQPAAPGQAPAIPGYTCNADGSRLPLGPGIEFKIIDYGLATFDQVLAQAAGGYESEQALAKLADLFAAQRVRFGTSSSNRHGVEIPTSRAMEGRRACWRLFPARLRSLLRPSPTSSDGSTSETASGQGSEPGTPTSHEASTRESGVTSELAASLHQVEPEAALQQEKGSLQPVKDSHMSRKQTMSPIEAMYRHFWRHKGDVFHLLLNLALVLDDRVWPREDQRDVQLLASLVHHVTGIKMKAAFVERNEPARASLLGRLLTGCVPAPRQPAEALRPATYGRHKWQHHFRRMHIRLAAHLFPYNSGLTAAEALVAPFFGRAARPAHAELPAPISRVFPER